MRRVGLALVLVALTAGSARAEPISAAIGLTALIQTVIGASIFGITAAQIGGAIVTIGLSIGLSLASRALLKKNTGGVETAAASRINERQAIPAVRVVVGRTKHGGPLCFEEVKPPYLYLGFILSEGPIDGVEKIWVGARALSFAEITEKTVLTPSKIVGEPAYDTRLTVSLDYGDPDDYAKSAVLADFAGLDGEFAQRGVATAFAKCHWGSNQDEYTSLWGQVARPTFLFQSKGIRVWDPRDPTQDADDEDTWKWSDNPTLHILHYARWEYGGRLFLDEFEWDMTKVVASANWDDSLVGVLAGGTMRRYTANGIYTLDQQPAQILADLLSANGAKLIDRGGKIWIDSRAPKTPVVTIHDGLLVGGFEFSNAKPKRDMLNRVKTRFVANDRDYAVVDGPVVENADYIAEDGEYLDGTLSLAFTDDHRAAQRQAKCAIEESRRGKSVGCVCDIRLLAETADELIGGCAVVSSNLFSHANGEYTVEKTTIDLAAMTIALELAEYDSAIETDWIAAVDEQEFVIPDPDVS